MPHGCYANSSDSLGNFPAEGRNQSRYAAGISSEGDQEEASTGMFENRTTSFPDDCHFKFDWWCLSNLYTVLARGLYFTRLSVHLASIRLLHERSEKAERCASELDRPQLRASLCGEKGTKLESRTPAHPLDSTFEVIREELLNRWSLPKDQNHV